MNGHGATSLPIAHGAVVSTDQEIFRQLYPALRRFAAVVGSMDVDPDDLVQHAITGALAGGRLSRFDSPGAYLRRAIVNAACNERRGATRRLRALVRLGGGMSEAEASTYPSELALMQLAPAARALTYLRVVEGLAYDDIAAMLGISAGSARMTVSRALRALRASELDSTTKDPS
jgi:RNA polymerase sigma factor (sigma-70 family)